MVQISEITNRNEMEIDEEKGGSFSDTDYVATRGSLAFLLRNDVRI